MFGLQAYAELPKRHGRLVGGTRTFVGDARSIHDVDDKGKDKDEVPHEKLAQIILTRHLLMFARERLLPISERVTIESSSHPFSQNHSFSRLPRCNNSAASCTGPFIEPYLYSSHPRRPRKIALIRPILSAALHTDRSPCLKTSDRQKACCAIFQSPGRRCEHTTIGRVCLLTLSG